MMDCGSKAICERLVNMKVGDKHMLLVFTSYSISVLICYDLLRVTLCMPCHSLPSGRANQGLCAVL